MKPIATVARIIGVDQLHVGTVVGKMSETKAEVIENIEACKAEMGFLKPVLPVASGGLHPRLVPALMETFGNDFVIQAGGGIHGHPDGTICRCQSHAPSSRRNPIRKNPRRIRKNHQELDLALKQWKTRAYRKRSCFKNDSLENPWVTSPHNLNDGLGCDYAFFAD